MGALVVLQARVARMIHVRFQDEKPLRRDFTGLLRRAMDAGVGRTGSGDGGLDATTRGGHDCLARPCLGGGTYGT